MHDIDEGFGAPMGDELRRISKEHAYILQLVSSKAISGVMGIGPRPLDTQEVGTCLQHRLLNKKGPLARTDLEFKWL